MKHRCRCSKRRAGGRNRSPICGCNAAARLGAGDVLAIEGDEFACEALLENVERNDVGDRVRLVEAWATSESIAALGPVSGIVANIESGLLLPLFTGFRSALPEGAWLIISGILDAEWPRVEAALARSGFEVGSVDADGDWRSGLFRRRAN